MGLLDQAVTADRCCGMGAQSLISVMWVMPWNRSFSLMFLWGSLGCVSQSYFLVRRRALTLLSWCLFCASAYSGGAGKTYVLHFALCWVWPACRQLQRDKVKFTTIPCSHQDPRGGQCKVKPPGSLSACLLCERLCDLKPCPKFSDNQPQAQSPAILKLGQWLP